MSTPQPPAPAKLVVSILSSDKLRLPDVVRQLMGRFGPLDTVSAWLPFEYTRYYEGEMGAPLYRRLVSFRRLIAQDALPGIKIFTNTIERMHAVGGRRRVNIDPGYLLQERFVLATGKNYTHRIYLAAGIYADLTLIYQKGGFRELPWTYPDYADRPIRDYLERVRRKYGWDLKQLTHAGDADGNTSSLQDLSRMGTNGKHT